MLHGLLFGTSQVDKRVADLGFECLHLVEESFGERARDMDLVIGDIIVQTAVTFVELREPVVGYFFGRIEGIGGVEIECGSKDAEVAGSSESADVGGSGDYGLES